MGYPDLQATPNFCHPEQVAESRDLRQAMRPQGVPEPIALNEVKGLSAATVAFSFTRFRTGKLIVSEHEYAMGSDFGYTLVPEVQLPG